MRDSLRGPRLAAACLTRGAFRRLVRCAGLASVLPAAAFGAAPVIDSFAPSSPSVVPGGTITLAVTARDPDCVTGPCTTGCGAYLRADLTGWSDSFGPAPGYPQFVARRNGTSGSPYTAEADWQAPAIEGSYSLTVSVADSGTSMCGGRQTTTATVSVLVTSTPNQPPTIDSLTATPGQVFPAQTSQLTCTAHDPDGGALAYTWTTDLGAVTAGAGGTASFAADAPGIAHVTCTASDALGAQAVGSIAISVTDAIAELAIGASLVTPHRLAVDSYGDLYVVDPGAGGIVVLHLATGERVYALPLPDATAVAVDWNDHLLVGRSGSAQVLARDGTPMLALSTGAHLGEIPDVAVDPINHRYVVLHRPTGHVIVYDASGAVFAELGSTGDASDQLLGPSGVAVLPDGSIAIADQGHGQVKVFTTAGALSLAFGSPGGGAGRFIALDDVAVTASGIFLVSDSYQDWLQSFNPDGSLRTTLGTYGADIGQFETATGLAPAEAFGRLVGASTNSSSLQVYRLDETSASPAAPAATLGPTTLDFGPLGVGYRSAPRVATLSNTGTVPLGVRALTVPPDFTLSHDCPPFLDPGLACTVSVTFAPLAGGPRNGVLAADTSLGEPHLLVGLLGEGLAPAGVALTPPLAIFPTQPVGTTSAPIAVVLTNPGAFDLHLAGITTTGDFASLHTCGTALGPGLSCTIQVYFTPQAAAGLLQGSLQILSDAAGAPHAAMLQGQATGLALAVDPSSLDFGFAAVGSSGGEQMVVVRNVGSDLLEMGQAALSGGSPDSFGLVVDACSRTGLPVGAACALTVRFLPQSAGALVAELSLPSTAPAGSGAVALTGNGIGGQSVLEIPSLSATGLFALALLLAFLGLAALRTRS